MERVCALAEAATSGIHFAILGQSPGDRKNTCTCKYISGRFPNKDYRPVSLNKHRQNTGRRHICAPKLHFHSQCTKFPCYLSFHKLHLRTHLTLYKFPGNINRNTVNSKITSYKGYLYRYVQDYHTQCRILNRNS